MDNVRGSFDKIDEIKFAEQMQEENPQVFKEGEVLEIGKHSDFRGNPTDKQYFEVEEKGAEDEDLHEISRRRRSHNLAR